ncbi:endonuclease/exonuclease/phosphatase family protein [Streptomyces tailanensis]|uniref:endonuclease/exonuclease/phosphatase family protein n=1 Tax=Streptomyces tailanensis TaxID=2569858 RepID=UPI00122EA307|nr:hypothetical protein [Streptomyces tailanensis]
MKLTVMSQNVQYGAFEDGRWEGLVEIIRDVDPQLLCLQEVDALADPERAESIRKALGMELVVAPSKYLPTALAWDPAVWEWAGTETKYSLTEMHHGYCTLQLRPLGLATDWPVPLVAISTHLNPYSAQAAAVEAQLLCARAYRHGGIGFIAGDINHMPLGDPEPDWSLVQPYNRTSRCLRRQHPDDPWQGNRIVGQTLRDGDFTDVAAHLADLHRDPELLQSTGRHGLLRVDQAHVTQPLVPAIRDYCRVDPKEYADHFGVVFTLDLDLVDLSHIRDFT